jgi:hypothetical protein
VTGKPGDPVVHLRVNFTVDVIDDVVVDVDLDGDGDVDERL